MKLLLVDDDADLLAVTAFALQQAGFLVVKASTCPAALNAFREEQPDLVILDVNLPGGSGFEVCTAIRRESRAPIMMLTVRGEEQDLVHALDLGADDYLTKPFSPRTLIARVKALLRRAGLTSSGRTAAAGLDLNADTLTLKCGDEPPIRVTQLESRLLHLLIAQAGQPVHADRLLAHVWGRKGGGDRQLLKQLVHRLRHKMGEKPEEPRWIETIPGVGYRIRVPTNQGEARTV
jgi:DNA-binding response OmpR family regulator